MTTRVLIEKIVCSFPQNTHLFRHLTPIVFTIMTLSFRTDGPGQTVQTQIRLLQEEYLISVFTVCYSNDDILTKYPKVWAFCLILGRLQQSFLASKNLGTLWYDVTSVAHLHAAIHQFVYLLYFLIF